jgi:hypothetical protein
MVTNGFPRAPTTTLSKITNSASAVPSNAKIEMKYLKIENQASYQLTKTGASANSKWRATEKLQI